MILKDGTILDADVVITGIGNLFSVCNSHQTQVCEYSRKKKCFSGVIPNSDFLQGSGVEMDRQKAVIVNKAGIH